MHPLRRRIMSPVILATGWTLSACCAADIQQGGYRLVWADEFDKDGPPNPKNWSFEQGFVRNQELQFYQRDNAVCKDGNLVIEACRERKANPGFVEGSKDWRTSRPSADYTSSSLMTRDLHAWQYGRFEIRAKIITQEGLWPAIWTLGNEGEWPSCGEIDIMEFFQGKIHANIYWGTDKRWGVTGPRKQLPMASFKDPEWDQRFHIWRMDWNRSGIEIFLDNALITSVDVTKTINPSDRGPRNPFQKPQYLILNLAVGGVGGDPGKTPFPSRYLVDYVRVYQKADADSRYLTAPTR